MLVIKGESTEAVLCELEACLALKPPGVMLHAGIKRSFLNGLNKLLAVDGVKKRGSQAPLLPGCLVSACLLQTDAPTLLWLKPSAMIVVCESRSEMLSVAERLQGQLTATVHGISQELLAFCELLNILEGKAGCLLINSFPTGVEVCASMHHGGPYPATTDSRSTFVGADASRDLCGRFVIRTFHRNYCQSL